MSRLEELIQEYCPDGVEYRPLGSFCKIQTGRGITNKDTSDDGLYPVISGGIEPMGYYNSFNREEDTVTIARAGSAGYVNFINTKFYLNDKCFSVIPVDETKSRYLYHALKNRESDIVSMKSTGSVPTVNTEKVSHVIVPVPPLPVQEEIVRILDSFTELTAELQAELQARKKQYECCRDKLLDNAKSTPKELGSMVRIKNGKDYKHLSEGNIPVYGSGGIMTYVAESSYDKPSVLIPRKGSIDKLYYVTTPFWNVDTVFYTEIDEFQVNPKFLFYLLQKEHLEQYNSAGGVPSLTQSILNKIVLQIPSIEEQNRIVELLDRFDTLCNDISSGLPAEIEARQKQYEYYRDKLLEFQNDHN